MENIKSKGIQNNFHSSLSKGFLKSVSAFPNHPALFINNRYYTYQQLWRIVFSVYQKIPTDKIYNRIGVYCNDDVYTYASLLAINLYGAAYVPINNKFPAIRNKNSVEQCDLKLILSSAKNRDLKEIVDDKIIIDTSNLELISETENLILKHSDYQKVKQEIGYILFTSGTTGEPKGVPVSHSNVNSFFNFFLTNYNFNERDKFLQVYELSFDVSVFSFFMPLHVGACCYVLPNDGIKFTKILQMLKEYKITVVSMVPSILDYIEKYLNEIKLPDLRFSFFSGDALYQNLAEKWSKAIPNAALHNFYGPTETTIVCTRYIWNKLHSSDEAVNGIVPLGKPFAGMETLIVDNVNKTTEKGELCFSGTQVISGYLNTENENKFFNYQGKRFYKTGDIVSYSPLKNLVFYGRTDCQVKINGYRVELGEIEFAIEKITKNKNIVLLNNDILTDFIETSELDEKNLIEKLSAILPDYMLPKYFIKTEKIPLNENGKVDRNKLNKLIE